MKRALILLAAALCLVGCAHATPKQYCHTASATVVHAVDLGMKVSADLYGMGKLNDAQKATLVKAYDIYYPIAVGVVTACKSVTTIEDADAQVKKLQGESDKVLSALVGAGVK